MTDKKFTVEAQINAWVSVDILASNWEDALKKAKDLNPDDFIRVKSGGDVIDWGLTLGAVRSSSVPDGI